MTKERILVIDDTTEMLRFLTDLLQKAGYAVSCSATGRDGLTKALRDKPDLILLDFSLPGMSGLEVLQALNGRGSQTPVILMTSYGSESVVVRALRLGARDYLAKPFDISDLLAAVERALETGRLRREREQLIAELSEANLKLTHRMNELSTLQAVGRSVASLMPSEQLWQRILDAAVLLTGADACAVFLRDGRDDRLSLKAVRHGPTYHFGLDQDVQDSLVQEVMHSARLYPVVRPSKRSGITGYLGQKAQSLLYAPIKLGEKPMGVLAVAFLSRTQVSDETQNRLMALADYVAIALENSRTYEESQLQTRQLASINHIARMVISSLEYRKIMEAVVKGLKESLQAETATLVLLDEANARLVFEVAVPAASRERAPVKMGVGQGIVGWVVRNGRALRVNDVSGDPRFFPGIDQITGFRTRSILCVPLAVSDRVIGAVEAVNKLDDRQPDGYGQFTAEDEELVCSAAAFVSMAVENARLHEAMRNSIAAQTVRETVVTLSHYVNNPLQALLGSAELLRDEMPAPEAGAEIVAAIERDVRRIAAVLSVLRDLVSPESTVYLGSAHMLDIESELRARSASAAAYRPVSA